MLWLQGKVSAVGERWWGRMSEARSHNVSGPCRKQKEVGREEVTGVGIALKLVELWENDPLGAEAGEVKVSGERRR